MQAKELIFKELLRRGYSRVDGHRVWSIADSKLWYLTPQQAKAYLSLGKSKIYKEALIDAEHSLIDEHVRSIIKDLNVTKGVNVIDVGCGNGRKALPVISTLIKHTPVRYCPVDVSGYMISEAIRTVGKAKNADIVQFKWNVADFEHLDTIAPLLLDDEFSHNLFLVFGNTIGNFEFHEVMYEIAEALRSNDYLLLGVPLRSPSKPISVERYQTRIQDDFLSLVLTQVGFRREDLQFKVEFNNSRFEGYYTILCDTTLAFGEQKLSFKKGDRIMVGVSYHYTQEELRKALEFYFKNVSFYLNSDKSSALVLCKK